MNSTAQAFASVVELEAEGDARLTVNLVEHNVRSHIADGDEFVGELRCKTGIRISGKVSGSVSCESGAVVVEKTAHVTGSITAKDHVFIDGRVGDEGTAPVEIQSAGLVALLNNANIVGNVTYGKLATYGEMTINGSVSKMKR